MASQTPNDIRELAFKDDSKSVGVHCCDLSFATAAEADAHEASCGKMQRTTSPCGRSEGSCLLNQ